LLFGNQGTDTISATSTAATVWGGLGNDSLFVGGGAPQTVFGNKGNDTVDGTGSNPITIVGGNDSADGSDGLLGGASTDLAFGNDTVNSGDGNDTLVGGQGGDSLFASGTGNNLVFANEGNDSVNVLAGNDTVFAGLGNDTIIGGNVALADEEALRVDGREAGRIGAPRVPPFRRGPVGRKRDLVGPHRPHAETMVAHDGLCCACQWRAMSMRRVTQTRSWAST
jgi:Ca2+-binding RTX toxin-like protein